MHRTPAPQRKLLVLAAAGMAALATIREARAQSHLYTFDANRPGEQYGASVSGAGDVNGDGADDLIVGAFATNRAEVLSGMDGAVIYSIDGGSGQFGRAVANAGDVNNDGFADVIIGAPATVLAEGRRGRVSVWSGSDGSLLHFFNATLAQENLGASVASAGDVNNDGFDDIIAGAPNATGFAPQQGRAIVWSGATGEILDIHWGPTASSFFGTSVSGLGDVNGDEFDDVIVGAPSIDGGIGYATVYSGEGPSVFSILGSSDDWFGYAVHGTGDIDGDGFGDMIIGAPRFDANGPSSGRAIVVSGKTRAILHTFDGSSEGDQFGWSVSDAGDANEDGFIDLLIGSPFADTEGAAAGAAHVYSGKDGLFLASFNGDQAGDLLGYSVSSSSNPIGGGSGLILGAPQGVEPTNPRGYARVYSGLNLPLSTDIHFVSLEGGTQRFKIDAGPTRADKLYLLVGSFLGTTPGTPLFELTLPLNQDPYLQFTLGNPNTIIEGSAGTLDGEGEASATFVLPPGVPSTLGGSLLHHAYIVIDTPFELIFVSNPVPLTLTGL